MIREGDIDDYYARHQELLAIFGFKLKEKKNNVLYYIHPKGYTAIVDPYRHFSIRKDRTIVESRSILSSNEVSEMVSHLIPWKDQEIMERNLRLHKFKPRVFG